VNAWYSGSISIKITFFISPYKIFKNVSNGHGCYFLKYYYSNLWIIYVQSPTNLPKFIKKFVFNIIDAILKIGSPKKKTHKVHMNNAPCKAFKNILLGLKNWKK
jgi:hypothetical protein